MSTTTKPTTTPMPLTMEGVREVIDSYLSAMSHRLEREAVNE